MWGSIGPLSQTAWSRYYIPSSLGLFSSYARCWLTRTTLLHVRESKQAHKSQEAFISSWDRGTWNSYLVLSLLPEKKSIVLDKETWWSSLTSTYCCGEQNYQKAHGGPKTNSSWNKQTTHVYWTVKMLPAPWITSTTTHRPFRNPTSCQPSPA